MSACSPLPNDELGSAAAAETPLELAVISPEGDDPREAALLSAFFESGLHRYHVRKPHWSKAQLERWVSAFPRAWFDRIVLHQHHELVDDLGLGGRHWRDDGTAPTSWPALRMRGLTSRSCHQREVVRKSLGLYDAVFFGPTFPSISKPGYGPSEGEEPQENVSSWLSERENATRRTTIFALGGITAARVAQCRAAGFGGVAVLGAIWRAEDPRRAFAQIRAATLLYAT